MSETNRHTLIISYQITPPINLWRCEHDDNTVTFRCNVGNERCFIYLFETSDQADAENRASDIARCIYGKYDEEIPHYIGNVELWHKIKEVK